MKGNGKKMNGKALRMLFELEGDQKPVISKRPVLKEKPKDEPQVKVKKKNKKAKKKYYR